jgi:hypothetical protein
MAFKDNAVALIQFIFLGLFAHSGAMKIVNQLGYAPKVYTDFHNPLNARVMETWHVGLLQLDEKSFFILVGLIEVLGGLGQIWSPKLTGILIAFVMISADYTLHVVKNYVNPMCTNGASICAPHSFLHLGFLSIALLIFIRGKPLINLLSSKADVAADSPKQAKNKKKD